jgi:P-type Ca2+ transporter type 2C
VLLDDAAPETVYDLLGSRPGGLGADEAAARLAAHGTNRLSEAAPARTLARLVAQFTHLMAVLLWIGGLLAFVAGMPQLGVAVWVVNLVNGAFSFWQEHRAERAVAALRALLPVESRVLRDGRELRVAAEELVPGDVLLLGEGDRISADARLVEAHGLRVDQSTLTGEAHPVRRTARPLPPAFARRDGPHQHGLRRDPRDGRPRQGRRHGHRHAHRVRWGGGAHGRDAPRGQSAAARARDPDPRGRGDRRHHRDDLLRHRPAAHRHAPPAGLVFALGMIVAFVPEGLLPTVTLALAMASQRMARRQALVKRLSAVEALGSTTVICTDKTGTLTANQMTARSIFQLDATYELTGTGYDPDGEIRRDGGPSDRSPTTSVCCCGRRLGERCPPGAARIRRHLLAHRGRPDRDRAEGGCAQGRRHDGGRATRRVGVRRPAQAHEHARADRSWAGGVHQGCAPRAPRALHTVRVDGVDAPLDGPARARVLAANDRYAREAMRVLAVAVRPLAVDQPRPRAAEEAESELVLLGLVALLDPPRPAVAEAVATCRGAGIRILMITGDYGLTAESIARRRRDRRPDEQVRIVNGSELDGLDDAGAGANCSPSRCSSRGSTPAHKLRVVSAAGAGRGRGRHRRRRQRRPGAQAADIGVAMGASGTDVAREAADIILLDDDFASIVAAVEEGRAVYANVRKFTGYIFTSNTPEAVPFVLFGLSGGASRSPWTSCTSSPSTSAPTSCRRWRSAPSVPSPG